jgi:putative ABC transport system permease protein
MVLTARPFTVYGVFDYWPSWNPIRGDDSGEGLRMGESATGPTLIVANLPYVQEVLGLEPYEIWLRYKQGAGSADLYQSIEDNNLRITSIRDSRQEITAVRNGPGNIGINGATTLGFITSLSITFLGMLIYWILAIRKRSFEFGMFRAMGVSLYQADPDDRLGAAADFDCRLPQPA